MNLNNFTIKAQEAVQRAQQLAMERESQAVEPGHLLRGILEVDENVAPFVFKKLGVNYAAVRKAIDSMVESYPRSSGSGQYLSRPANEILQKANTYLKEFGDEYVTLEHLLLACLVVKDQVSQMLKDSGLSEQGLKAAIKELRKGGKVDSHSAEQNYNALNKYGVNLNERARSSA